MFGTTPTGGTGVTTSPPAATRRNDVITPAHAFLPRSDSSPDTTTHRPRYQASTQTSHCSPRPTLRLAMRSLRPYCVRSGTSLRNVWLLPLNPLPVNTVSPTPPMCRGCCAELDATATRAAATTQD